MMRWLTKFFYWPIIRYVPAGSLKPFAGISFLWRITIDTRYATDDGLLVHEKTHFNQWLKSPILHPIKYELSNVYRYHAELEAYRNQLNLTFENRAGTAELFASFILNRYNLDGLDLTIESIKKDLLA